MATSADPDQLASYKPTDLNIHCLQRQGIFGCWNGLLSYLKMWLQHIIMSIYNVLKSLTYFPKDDGDEEVEETDRLVLRAYCELYI